MFGIYIQVVGYPRLCDSIFLGITQVNSLLNRSKVYHIPKYICSSEDRESVIINYTVSNLGPQLNYIFIADILNHFNYSKRKNVSYFSE